MLPCTNLSQLNSSRNAHRHVYMQTYTHTVYEAAVTAVVPVATGWCTLSLLWINAAQPMREQPQWNTPIALSHWVVTLQEWGISWQWAPCSSTSTFSHFSGSANWLMIKPIKVDFNIVCHWNPVASGWKYIFSKATHNSKTQSRHPALLCFGTEERVSTAGSALRFIAGGMITFHEAVNR